MRLPWLQSDLHPHALSLTEEALTHPDFAQALADDLAALNPPEVIHRFRIVALKGQATETLRHAGFTATRLTQIINLSLDALDAGPLPAHIAAHWFKPGERAPWDLWVQAHWQHYRATHASNPPRPPASGMKPVFVGDDLEYGLALRDGPQGRLRAFGSLRTGQDLGWIGGDPELVPHGLDACLRRATAIGWTHATLEVDDDDRVLWSLIQSLSHPPQDTYITWHLERDAARRPN